MVKASPLTIIKVSTSQTDLTTTFASRTLSAKLTTSSTIVTPSTACTFLETIGARSRTFLSCKHSGDLRSILAHRWQKAAGFGFQAAAGSTRRDLATPG